MNILTIIQVIIAVALIAVILLQNRDAGAGGLFGGGSGGSGSDFSAKRGLEKILFRATIALALAFLFVALLNLAQ